MSIQIEMTGKEDREGPWKLAICGFGGAGKTLFGSTAPKPLYVFFADSPRIKSIAMRHMPHVKLVNKYHDGVLQTSVQDQLQALVMNLQLTDTEFETLVIDTGDELFQAMKEARRAQNGGEFGPGDWGWIADAYREIITGLVDLPMHVIVLYHIKTSQEGDTTFRELMLQGQAKDEAPGWFDVVGVLENYEVILEDGSTHTKRVLLTNGSRMYPWVKDHSGALPRPFEISDTFVGDFDRMLALLTNEEEEAKEGQEHTVLGVVPTSAAKGVKSGAPVPSPEQLAQKKRDTQETPGQEPEKVEEPEEGPSGETAAAEPEPEKPVVPEEPAEDEGKHETGQQPEVSDDEALEAAEAAVKEEFPDAEIVCSECKQPIDDENVRELGMVRFRTYLCRPHYMAKLKEARNG